MTMIPAFDNTKFRGRNDDGNETGASWKAAADTNFTQDTDVTFRIRIVVAEIGATSFSDANVQLERKLNAGAWGSVTGSSTVVRSQSSANVVDKANTTQQIGSGTFITTNYGIDEVNGVAGELTGVNGVDFAGSDEAEFEWSIRIRSADVSDGDTVQLRGTVIGESNSYTKVVSITVNVPASSVSGTGAVVLTGISVDASAELTFSATGVISLASITVDAYGEETFDASGDINISGIDVAAQGAITFVGAGDINLAGIDVAAQGAITFVGAGDIDLAGVDVAATGSETFSGVGNIDLVGIGVTADGFVGSYGTGAISLAEINVSAAGFVGSYGTGNINLAGVDVAAQGAITFVGAGDIGLAGVDVAATGSETFSGLGDVNLTGIVISAQGSVGFYGAGNINLAGIDVAAQGAITFVGAGDIDLAGVDVAATGSETFLGTGSVEFSNIIISASGFTGFYGPGAIVLANINITALGSEIFSGVGDIVLDGISGSGVGGEIFEGVGDINFAGVSVSGSGDVGVPSISGSGAITISGIIVDALGSIPIITPIPSPSISQTSVKIKPPGPLLFDQAIAKPDGTPTDYFLRQWELQRQTNKSLDDVIKDIVTLNDTLTAVMAINLIAGIGLEGGGTLNTSEINFNLTDTGVTPDTYGDATHVAQITVDKQGRVTAAQEVVISGGGGGGVNFAWPTQVDDVASIEANAFKGVEITPLLNMSISGIAALINTVAGATYRAAVYRLDGSSQIDEITGVSADTASPGTLTMTNLYISLSSVANLVAGSKYVVVIGRIDDTAAHVLPLSIESFSATASWFSNVPIRLYEGGISFPVRKAVITSTNPVIGTAVAFSGNTEMYGIGFTFSL